MRILYVVQRYGREVAGGAEAHAAMFATRLAARGHQVSVLTSCARDYDTWADDYPPGTTTIDGVEVTRLSTPRPRDPTRFSALSQRVLPRPDRTVPAVVESAWMYEQGPLLDGFGEVFGAMLADTDVVVAWTYLYATTARACELAAGRVPIVVHPTAHEEWPIRLACVRSGIDRADGLACSTPEELEIVRRRFRPDVPAEVIGIGFEAPEVSPVEIQAFRDRFELGDAPYVVCLGRIDPNKGSGEAIRFMATSRSMGLEAPLVMAGAKMMEVADHDGVVLTGFVDDATRWAALAGAAVLLQPSRQESFGMTLAEAWLMGVSVLVRQDCDVTAGLVRRSGAGLTYATFSEYDAALRVLLDTPTLRAELGQRGRRYVETTYQWDGVLERYEDLLDRVALTARR